MAIRNIKEFENRIMNFPCSEDKALDADIYMGTLSSVRYCALSERDRKFVIIVHKHLKACTSCKEYYVDSKRDAASDNIYSGIYSPENFKLLRENEEYLDSLI